jgi:hypothetical protein
VLKWLFTAGCVLVAVIGGLFIAERYGWLIPPSKTPALAAAPAAISSDCELVQVKNARFDGVAMEYPLWFVTTRDGVARVRNCVGSQLRQEGNKWPNVRVAQPTTGFASVAVPKENLLMFFPDENRTCYVASRNAGQQQIILTRGQCPQNLN